MRVRYVYLIGPEYGSPLKIGIASDLASRLTALQTGSWEQLIVHHTVTVPLTIAAWVETQLHLHFEEHRIRGEWFRVDLDTAKPVLDEVSAWAYRYVQERAPFSFQNCVGLTARPADTQVVVTSYRNAARSAPEVVKAINARLLSRVGMAAYVTFTQCVVDGKNLSSALSDQMHLYRAAEAAMVKALDALVEIYAEDGKVKDGFLIAA